MDRVVCGDEFLVSALTHFEILWGYRKVGLATERYDAFLSKLEINVAPLLEEDAVLAANKKPGREKLVDALIAATVSRYDSLIWTRDTDYLQFLPKEKVIIIQQTSRYPSEGAF
ncbi:MAG: PIN domain-containing protein [Candidatus Bathyarchaeia archaeon]